MVSYPRMIFNGTEVQVAAHAYASVPTTLDEQTSWKLCSRFSPGAQWVGDVYVKIDRLRSIRNNFESIKMALRGEDDPPYPAYYYGFARNGTQEIDPKEDRFVPASMTPLGPLIDTLDIVRHTIMMALGR